MVIEKAHFRRLSVVLFFGVLFWSLLVGRLVSVQLKRGALFQQMADRQQLRLWKLKPRRGTLYDRRMIPLTLNLVFDSFGACPESVQNRDDVASRLSPVLGTDRKRLVQLLSQESPFVWLARKVDPEVGERIGSLNLPGVQHRREVFRYYPFGALGGQVIGFTDADSRGIEGMELEMDSLLKGTFGKCLVEMDANRCRHSDVKLPYDPPEDGYDVVLTLDARYQSIVEEELRTTVKRYGAKGAMAVVMIPQTGEILAMANLPDCDLNHLDRCGKARRKNRVVTDIFEPGSIFKVVTAAAALQEGIIRPEDSLYAEDGTFSFAGTILHDWKRFGWVTFRQAIEQSVNIAVAKVALKVGPSIFYEYATNFGFGCKTGVQFPGEVEGILRNPASWSKRSLMTLSLGQEVSVTALQIACAYAAVANRGRLMQPQIVKRVLNRKGEVVEEMEPMRVRTLLRPEIARVLTQFLTGVVDRGTGVKARVDRITVAGKTGTAQKVDGRGYSRTKFVASFVGFLPAEEPRLVGVVVVDEPRGVHWGGEVAAPAFGRIMKRLVHLPDSPVEDFLWAQADLLIDDGSATIAAVKEPTPERAAELLSQRLKSD